MFTIKNYLVIMNLYKIWTQVDIQLDIRVYFRSDKLGIINDNF